jgi:hypothetical protein
LKIRRKKNVVSRRITNSDLAAAEQQFAEIKQGHYAGIIPKDQYLQAKRNIVELRQYYRNGGRLSCFIERASEGGVVIYIYGDSLSLGGHQELDTWIITTLQMEIE